MTATCRAGNGLGPGLRARPATGCAFLHGRNAHSCLGTAGRVFERNFKVVSQVGAAIHVGSAAPAGPSASEYVAKDVTKRIGETTESSCAAAHCSRLIYARMSVLVVGASFLRIGDNLVGFLSLLELFFCSGIVRISIRMVLHRQLAIGFLDFVVGGVSIYAKNFIVVAFGHIPGMRCGRRKRHHWRTGW